MARHEPGFLPGTVEGREKNATTALKTNRRGKKASHWENSSNRLHRKGKAKGQEHGY